MTLERLFTGCFRQVVGQRLQGWIKGFPLHPAMLTQSIDHLFGSSVDLLGGEVTGPCLLVERPLLLKFVVLVKFVQRNTGDPASGISESLQWPLHIQRIFWPGVGW